MLFAIAQDALAVYLCWPAFVGPRHFRHCQRKVMRLDLVPHQKTLSRRKAEVVAAPNNCRFPKRNTVVDSSNAWRRSIPIQFFMLLTDRVCGNTNPIRRICLGLIHFRQMRHYFPAVTKVKVAVSNYFCRFHFDRPVKQAWQTKPSSVSLPVTAVRILPHETHLQRFGTVVTHTIDDACFSVRSR